MTMKFLPDVNLHGEMQNLQKQDKYTLDPGCKTLLKNSIRSLLTNILVQKSKFFVPEDLDICLAILHIYRFLS